MELFRHYIPTVSLTGIVCRYIPTELETKLFPSVKIIDENIPSVIPLVFADFLVVIASYFILHTAPLFGPLDWPS